MKIKKIVILFFMLQYFSHCLSQEFWESLYESPDVITCVTINYDGDIFVGTGEGVVYSVNDGINWENSVLNGISCYSLLVNNDDYIFAGTGGIYNIYCSLDNGINWQSQNLNTNNIISLFENSDGNIFAGSYGYETLYQTNNNGEDWDIILSLEQDEFVESIIEDSNNTIYIGTTDFWGGGGIYRSTDGGDNWNHIGLANEHISSLAINSNDVIFAGSRGHHYEFGGGLFCSLDYGETWTELRNDILVTAIVINSEDDIYISCSTFNSNVGSVHYSKDNGENWQIIDSEIMPSNTSIENLTITDDDYLYAVGYMPLNQIFRSLNPTVETEAEDDIIQMFDEIKLNNYPNPFNPTTTISFSIPEESRVELSVFNIKGQKVKTLAKNSYQKGKHSVVWNGKSDTGKSVSSGIYFYKLSVNGTISHVRKCILLK